MDIRDLLEEGLGMAGLRTTKRIDTTWSCAEGLPKLQGNPVLIREALSNFFSNVLEAMEDGGQISIDVANVNDRCGCYEPTGLQLKSVPGMARRLWSLCAVL